MKIISKLLGIALLITATAGCQSNVTGTNSGLVGDGHGTMIGNPKPPVGQLEISKGSGQVQFVVNITAAGSATVTSFDDGGGPERFATARTSLATETKTFHIEAALKGDLNLKITLYLDDESRVIRAQVLMNGSDYSGAVSFVDEQGNATKVPLSTSSPDGIPAAGFLTAWDAEGETLFYISIQETGWTGLGWTAPGSLQTTFFTIPSLINTADRTFRINGTLWNNNTLEVILYLGDEDQIEAGEVFINGTQETPLLMLHTDVGAILPPSAPVLSNILGNYSVDETKTICKNMPIPPDISISQIIGDKEDTFLVSIEGDPVSQRSVFAQNLLRFRPSPENYCGITFLETEIKGMCFTTGKGGCAVYYKKEPTQQ